MSRILNVTTRGVYRCCYLRLNVVKAQSLIIPHAVVKLDYPRLHVRALELNRNRIKQYVL